MRCDANHHSAPSPFPGIADAATIQAPTIENHSCIRGSPAAREVNAERFHWRIATSSDRTIVVSAMRPEERHAGQSAPCSMNAAPHAYVTSRNRLGSLRGQTAGPRHGAYRLDEPVEFPERRVGTG